MKLIYTREEKDNLTEDELLDIFTFTKGGTEKTMCFCSDIKEMISPSKKNSMNNSLGKYKIIMKDNEEINVREESFKKLKTKKLRYELFVSNNGSDIGLKELFVEMFESKMSKEMLEIAKEHYNSSFKKREEEFVKNMDKLESIEETINNKIINIEKISNEIFKETKKDMDILINKNSYISSNLKNNFVNFSKSLDSVKEINKTFKNNVDDINKDSMSKFNIKIDKTLDKLNEMTKVLEIVIED